MGSHSPMVAGGSAVMDASCARIPKEPNEFDISALPQTRSSAQDDGGENYEAEKQRNNNRRNEPVLKAKWRLKRHDDLPRKENPAHAGFPYFRMETSYFCFGVSGEDLLSPSLF